MAKKCTDCGRPQLTSVIGPELCEACYEYASWENTHSDRDHEGIEEVEYGQTTHKTRKAFEAWKQEVRDEMKACPVCDPSLDPRKPRRVVTGTSRLGMTMVVSLRASGADKAAQVKAQLPGGFRGKTEINELSVDMTGSRGKGDAKVAFEAHWDAMGRWTGGSVNGKKVRNAKELLRVLGA